MLGRHLRAAMEARGAEVISVSRTGSGDTTAWDLSEWKSEAALDSLFPDIQAIVHAGALISADPLHEQARWFDINVRACVNIAKWSLTKGIPLVFVSSASVYADPEKSFLSEDAPRGSNNLGGFYGMTKLLAEDLLERFRSCGLQLAVVRPSSLYGFGGPRSKMLYRFLEKAARGETITLAPPVDDSVDFVHAADLSRAIIKIIEKNSWHTFNIASGMPVSIRELAAFCVEIAGGGKVEITNPHHAAAPFQRFFLDTRLAQQRLGWAPTIGIKQGLAMVLSEQLIAQKS
jgi:nucleoside-diphosphate-sugar epimerase